MATGTTQIKDSEAEWKRPEDDVYDLLDQGRFLQQGRGRDNESNEEVIRAQFKGGILYSDILHATGVLVVVLERGSPGQVRGAHIQRAARRRHRVSRERHRGRPAWHRGINDEAGELSYKF